MARKTMAYVVYPGISLLELVGTRSMLGSIAGMAGYEPVVVAEKKAITPTDTPLDILPQKSFDEVPQPDGLVVIGGQAGGGADSLPALENPRLVEYIRRAGEQAEVVASVSTGSLLLAAAGLLNGRPATTHWAYAEKLNALGGIYEKKPWVEDGRITTSAGVSGGVDMGIALGAKLAGKAAARQGQLSAEYDPHPPFGNIDWERVNKAEMASRMDARAAANPNAVASATAEVTDITFVIYPDLTVFDLAGPLQVISALSRIDSRFRPVVVSEHRGPVSTDIGVDMIPNATFDERPHPDGFVVPGGDTATLNAMSNLAIRGYIRSAARDADWIVSVCTGALILASVGLLEGREVTTHWAYRRYLEAFGARYVQKRWTHNGKIINSAGVSAGIDMALYLVAQMAGAETARQVQLMIQYDPQPPFGGIDYENLGFVPRLMRSANGLRSIFYTSKPRQMIRQGV